MTDVHEHTTSKETGAPDRSRLTRLIAAMSLREWLISGFLVLLLASLLGFLLFSLRGYSTITQGVRSLDLPWTGEGIAVVKVASGWRQMQPGVESYHPSIDMTVALTDTERGELWIQFVDEKGDAMGDPVSFSYRDGRIDDTKGSMISVTCSRGIEGASHMDEYLLDNQEPWRFHVSYRRAGQRVVYLGSGDVARILFQQSR